MQATRQVGIALVGVLVLGGCEGVPVEPGDPITEEEAKALFFGAGVARLLEDTSRIVENRGDTFHVSCQLGGTATVVFPDPTVRMVGDTVRQSTLAEMRYSSCEFESDGFHFVLAEGSHMDHLIGLWGARGSLLGAFGEATASLDWSLADRFNTCEIDLVADGVLDISDPANPVGNPWPHYSGTVCGHEAMYEIAFEYSGQSSNGDGSDEAHDRIRNRFRMLFSGAAERRGDRLASPRLTAPPSTHPRAPSPSSRTPVRPPRATPGTAPAPPSAPGGRPHPQTRTRLPAAPADSHAGPTAHG